MSVSDLIVIKFGGSSLSTPERRALAADIVRQKTEEGGRVVAVVSAMGREGDPYATDTLLGLMHSLPEAAAREVDALAACGEEISAAVLTSLLKERGMNAVSLRGFQAGIITDEKHGDADIREIRPVRILEHLERGEIVVVAGFQGITEKGEVTTLGRGGSDTTAVALAAALSAERVEIYTDVDGVRTADPRMVGDPRAVPEITYEESAELAFKGARILHPRAAERARASGVAVEIRNTVSSGQSTWLVPDEGRWSPDGEMAPRTISVTSTAGIAQLSITGIRFLEDPDLLERILGKVARRGISLDMMSICPDRVAFTLKLSRAAEAADALSALGVEVEINERCAKVTLVGGGIHGIPGVMHRIVRALARKGIGIHQSVDSNMIISVLVDAGREEDAVRTLHEEFFG